MCGFARRGEASTLTCRNGRGRIAPERGKEMPRFWLALAVLVLAAAAAVPGWTQPVPAVPAITAPEPRAAIGTATAGRRFAADGQDFAYTVRAAWQPVPSLTGAVTGEVFHVAYTRDGAAAPTRPILFAFNGGPGASSVYLHLGAMGPRRAAVGPDGTLQPGQPMLVDNAESWLSFADMVFVDPVGTGLSRIAGGATNSEDARAFWDVEIDARSMARFVRDFLQRTGRRESPLYLVGESYGGFRVARMARMLSEFHGIRPAGLVMVSPVLDRGAMAVDPFMPVPAMLRLPTYAAIAWRHERVAGVGRDAAARDLFVAEAERFALGDGLIAASAGDALSVDRRKAFHAGMARFTGLSLEDIARRDGVIGPDVFAAMLLAGSGRVLGLYDASVTLPRGDRTSGLRGLGSTLGTAIETYLRDEVGLATSGKYVPLNFQTSRDWQWLGRGDFGYPNAAPRLREALIADAALRVLIVHGRYDLVTPFASSTWTVAQLRLPPARRAAIRFGLFEGGHMMYLHDESRRGLTATAREFIAQPAPAAP